MNLKLISGIISSAMSVVVFIPYYRDIFKKKTQPHMYSWLVWGTLQIVGTLAVLKGGGGYGSWWLAVGAIFCLGIFLLSFKYGTKNIKPFDVYCLIACVFAFLLYVFITDPIYSVLLVVATDTIGFFPTFRKGYEEPHSETASLYLMSAPSIPPGRICRLMSALTNLVGLVALQEYSITTALYTSVLLVTNSTMCTILFLRRRSIKSPINI